MPRVNLELLDKVLDYIIDHPDEWNQNVWCDASEANVCGTVMCFAGHAATMTGHKYTLNEESGDWELDGGLDSFDVGQEVLGLTHEEAQRLFVGSMFAQDADYYLDKPTYQLKNVKVEVERIRARAKAQEAAFNRIAQQFIDAAGLDDVVKPGYKCPESAEVLQGNKGGASE